jgi:CRP-like cAMP-binding protein
LENNSKFLDSLDEQEKLLNDLPASLRSEVVKHTHGTIINRIHFFKDQNLDFLWAILPMLRPISIQAKDIIYSHGDHSDEVYFIQEGRVRLFTLIKDSHYPEVQIPFKAYGEGTYFGDSDIFSNDESKGREGTAIAEVNCQIQVLIRKDLMQLMEDFEEVM